METNKKFEVYRDFLVRIVQAKGGDTSKVVSDYPLLTTDPDSSANGADQINMVALSPLLTGSGEDEAQ